MPQKILVRMTQNSLGAPVTVAAYVGCIVSAQMFLIHKAQRRIYQTSLDFDICREMPSYPMGLLVGLSLA